MNLREYTSNDAALLDQLPPEDRSKAKIPKVMGLYWSIEGDTLSVPGADSFNGDVQTKRDMLHTVAHIFDPLGFFAPVTLKFKLLIQALWKMEHDSVEFKENRKLGQNCSRGDSSIMEGIGEGCPSHSRVSDSSIYRE